LGKFQVLKGVVLALQSKPGNYQQFWWNRRVQFQIHYPFVPLSVHPNSLIFTREDLS
jgi:hypothetical protein